MNLNEWLCKILLVFYFTAYYYSECATLDASLHTNLAGYEINVLPIHNCSFRPFQCFADTNMTEMLSSSRLFTVRCEEGKTLGGPQAGICGRPVLSKTIVHLRPDMHEPTLNSDGMSSSPVSLPLARRPLSPQRERQLTSSSGVLRVWLEPGPTD